MEAKEYATAMLSLVGSIKQSAWNAAMRGAEAMADENRAYKHGINGIENCIKSKVISMDLENVTLDYLRKSLAECLDLRNASSAITHPACYKKLTETAEGLTKILSTADTERIRTLVDRIKEKGEAAIFEYVKSQAQ